jgi:hypothetical protein
VFEKRKVERFNLKIEAAVTLSDEVSRSKLLTRDISMSGAFILTNDPLPIGSQVNVSMILSADGQKDPSTPPAVIKASGVVLRTDNDGMAIGYDKNARILPSAK